MEHSVMSLKIIEYIQKVGYLQNQAFESLFPMISEVAEFDQAKAIVEVKGDMEAEPPMDRLVCGDVEIGRAHV